MYKYYELQIFNQYGQEVISLQSLKPIKEARIAEEMKKHGGSYAKLSTGYALERTA